ncbi:hypothetical protein [Dysosmobacter welbionis]|jgi:hypothetical protein|uniref:hypothetical protein n=2 Tax=Eubacteriales TaxID=186802 RepID=UPI0029426481|nr:hypothetical protein [Dysosmobacter welbionis]
MVLEMAQQKRAISETMVLMEAYLDPKFNALSERLDSIERKRMPWTLWKIAWMIWKRQLIPTPGKSAN